MKGPAEKQYQHTLGNKCSNIHSLALSSAQGFGREAAGRSREAVNVSWGSFQGKAFASASTLGSFSPSLGDLEGIGDG